MVTYLALEGRSGEFLRTFYQMIGIIFFAHMGVLHLLVFSDGISVTGIFRQREVPFRMMNVLMPLSTCMGSRPGLRVVKVMRPEFSVRVFDVIRPADGKYNQLTQQRRGGREGGVSKGS